ncbi:MAG: alpha/beta hydrolase, partial [Bacteroidota bacterium]
CRMEPEKRVLELPLYSTDIPGAIANTSYLETPKVGKDSLLRIWKVSKPTLTVYLSKNPRSNRTGVVICAGGGYRYLSIEKEGHNIAKWFQQMGVTAAVLKYRLPHDDIMERKQEGPLQDARRALMLMRENAGTWGLQKDQIGIMGFSAGGHLAATASTLLSDDTLAQPAFSLLIYPVVSMGAYTHKGSRERLLGVSPSDSLLQRYSCELQVSENTAPAFLIHANDDTVVPPENSILYHRALSAKGVSAELHLYEKGGHGFAGAQGIGSAANWQLQCKAWLQMHGWIE